MPRVRTARVAFARILAAREHDDSETQLKQRVLRSLVPGTAIERYGREWRLARFEQVDKTFRDTLTANDRTVPVIVGRIGYQRPGDLTELWDPDRNDFTELRNVEGMTSPYALNLDNLAVIFQLRSSRIKQTSFTGAFQALLNEGHGDLFWRVEPIVQGVTWTRWEESVRRITHIDIKVTRPNPNYKGRNELEARVEGANAGLIRYIADARDDSVEGLNVGDTLISEAIEHALDGYGEFRASGTIDTDEGPHQSLWRSDREGSPLVTDVPIDPAIREADHRALVAEVPVAPPEVIDERLRNELVAPPPSEDDGGEDDEGEAG